MDRPAWVRSSATLLELGRRCSSHTRFASSGLTGGGNSANRFYGLASGSADSIRWQTLVRHYASGSAFSRSRRATGTAFPSVSWRHTEPPGAVVLALGPGAWGRPSFLALSPLRLG